MRRCILISNRQNKDEKTGDELLFLTLSRLPTKMNNGGLWYPKKDEQIISACINKTRSPEDYEKMVNILPGTLIDVTFGLNAVQKSYMHPFQRNQTQIAARRESLGS